MRDRNYRRNQRQRTIEKCKRILEQSHFQGGTMYKKHTDKIKEKGFGYMSKHGTIKHFVAGNEMPSKNVRDRDSYNGTNNWDVKDRRQMDAMDVSEEDYITEYNNKGDLL